MASLGQERRFQEIKDQLIEIFKPKTNELYQDISVFNNQNEVINSINPDRIRLVIPEPRSDADAKKWVEETINQAEHKNRLLFLIPKNNRDLLVLAARVRAINAIASDDKSSSYKEELLQKRDRAIQNLYSAIKECYSGLALLVRGGDLVYPDIKFSFTNSDFNGEAQIIAAVSQYGKYLNKATDDDIKTRIETVIFNGVSELTWNEVRDKCSKNTQFPWYKHGRLDEVKRILIESKRWTENSSYIDITGKVQPDIDITLLSSHGNIRHFKFTLHSTDTVYWDTKHPDLNSPKVSNIESFESSELELYFMAALGSVIGKIHVRCGQIIIKKNPIQKDGKTYLELSTTPSDIPIEVMVDGQSFFYKEPFLLTGNAEINASKGAAKANTVYQRIDEKVQATNLYTHSFKVHGVQNINTFLDVSIKYGAVFKDFEFSSLKTSFFIVEDVFDSSKVRDVFNCMLKALDRQDIVFVYENPENPIKFPSIKHREEWENELKGVMK